MRSYQPIRQPIFWGLPLIAVFLLGIGTAAHNGNQSQGPNETLQVIPLSETPGSTDVARGAVRLNRARNEIWGSVSVTDLNPASAFTVWGAVFNDPDDCTTNPPGPIFCGMPDLVAGRARGSAFNIGAFLTSGIGSANADFHIRSGSPPAGTFILFGEGGLNDNGVSPGLRAGQGFDAEVHVVVRAHGAIIEAVIAAQLSQFNGGCPPHPAATCANVQVALFPQVTP